MKNAKICFILCLCSALLFTTVGCSGQAPANADNNAAVGDITPPADSDSGNSDSANSNSNPADNDAQTSTGNNEQNPADDDTQAPTGNDAQSPADNEQPSKPTNYGGGSTCIIADNGETYYWLEYENGVLVTAYVEDINGKDVFGGGSYQSIKRFLYHSQTVEEMC